MDIGIMLGDHPASVTPAEHLDLILRQAEAAQRNGVTYLLIGQHFLFAGGSRWLQPVPLLARLAGELDDNVRVATQIIVSPLYHPVMLAEELATLDIVTGGRLDVGLGIGYIEHEYETFGIPFDERIARFEEGIELMRLLWTEDEVTFAGKFYRVDQGTVHIKPIQQPHPPIWIGAQSKNGILRAARLADAWPITPHVTAADLPGRVKIFADERERLGMPFGRLPLRREIVVGRDREDALAKAVTLAKPWYLQMASQGTKEVNEQEVLAEMPAVVSRSFVIGSASECAEQLRAIGDLVPVNPVVTRGNWPGMTAEQAVGYIDDLGRELIPSLRDYEPTRTLRMPA